MLCRFFQATESAVKDGIENSPVSFAKISISTKTVTETRVETQYVEKIVTETDTVYVDKTYASPVIFTPTDIENGVLLSLATASENAKIYYTLDGTTPTANSFEYSTALEITENTTIKAIAVKNGIEPSPISIATVTITERQIEVDETAPSNVTNLAAANKSGAILLTWTDTNDEDIYGYEVSVNGSVYAIILHGKEKCLVGELTNDPEGKASFIVSENGAYDVVAIDADGRTVWNQAIVKTIDKTPPSEVRLPAVDFDSESDSTAPIKITWLDPEAEDLYDSPIDYVIVTYTVNEDATVIEMGKIDAGTQELRLSVPSNAGANGTLYITLKTVDKLGQVSEGVTVQAWCFSSTITATASDVVSKITSLEASAKIVLTGEIASSTISNIESSLKTLYNNNESIIVNLDLSRTSGISEIKIANCDNLVGITLPEGLTTLSDSAFNLCHNLSVVSLPTSLTTINHYAFGSCQKLTSIAIPNTVTKIEYRAFNNASSLTEIVIPENVTELGSRRVNSNFGQNPCLCGEKEKSSLFEGGK